MVLIITCELMQIQNTAPSHTQTSMSTQQGVFLVLLYLFKFSDLMIVTEDGGGGGNQVFQYWQ